MKALREEINKKFGHLRKTIDQREKLLLDHVANLSKTRESIIFANEKSAKQSIWGLRKIRSVFQELSRRVSTILFVAVTSAYKAGFEVHIKMASVFLMGINSHIKMI